jgi:hypothetical protein
LTVTDTTTEPAGIVVMRWRNDFRDGGSEPEHNGGLNHNLAGGFPFRRKSSASFII